jgi:hypothetical protein
VWRCHRTLPAEGPAHAGRDGTEPNRSDRVRCCGREAPPFTAGEDVTSEVMRIHRFLNPGFFTSTI